MRIKKEHLPDGWEIKKLEEVCIIKPPKKEAREKLKETELVSFLPMKDLGVCELNVSAIEEKPLKDVAGSYTYFANDDVLLAKITPCFENGKLGIAKNLTNGIGFGSSEYIVFRSKKELYPEFLFYFLSRESFREQGKERMTGAVGHQRVSKDFIDNVEIPFPPLPEQQRIVSLLDTAFEAIDQAKANAEKNLVNAKELFESYLQGVFENEEWGVKKWGELCDFVRGPFGGSLKKSMFVEEGYVVYEQKHAIHNHFNQLRYFIDEQKFSEMKRFELLPGDIIMSCSGVTLGRVAVVPEGIARGIINQALLKLTPKEIISVDFLKHWLRSKIFQDIIVESSGGAAIPNVPAAKILKEIKIPCPPIDIQIAIVDKINRTYNETQQLETLYQKKIVALDELKKSILQKAFRGELETE